MLRRIGIISLTICAVLALAACEAKPEKPKMTFNNTPIEQDDNSDITLVRTLAFRELLKNHPPGLWAFLSYGRGGGTAYSSATRQVIGQLGDMKLKLLPASMANPPILGQGGHILHIENGEMGYLYTVVITRWVGRIRRWWRGRSLTARCRCRIQGGDPARGAQADRGRFCRQPRAARLDEMEN